MTKNTKKSLIISHSFFFLSTNIKHLYDRYSSRHIETVDKIGKFLCPCGVYFPMAGRGKQTTNNMNKENV